jgi:hypothetical protein
MSAALPPAELRWARPHMQHTSSTVLLKAHLSGKATGDPTTLKEYTIYTPLYLTSPSPEAQSPSLAAPLYTVPSMWFYSKAAFELIHHHVQDDHILEPYPLADHMTHPQEPSRAVWKKVFQILIVAASGRESRDHVLTLNMSNQKKSRAFWGADRRTLTALPAYRAFQPPFRTKLCARCNKGALEAPGDAMACSLNVSSGAVAVRETAPAAAPASR